ncbi:MAG: hypothetical protein HFH68_00745 [Lachnospiraceae bacterium]|nr:hypothetical protein [Lachnospiraceae bacterium]
MALTKLETDILDKMSFAKGGGYMRFADNQYRVEPADDGFLFIGLGGKGGRVLRELKAGIYKNFKFDKDKTHPDNMEFMAIDTDQNELEKLCNSNNGKMGLESVPENNEICQLYDADAADRLKPENRHTIPDNITYWLNPRMEARLTGAGAGGIRQAARYLLFSNGFSKVKIGIESKLSKLHDVISSKQNAILDIFIFAGIGGGTGSGTIVDIPYIVREICEQHRWQCKISGYLMMPDTYTADVTRAEARWNNVCRNTYAALKEINYYMLLESLKGTDKFSYKYGDGFKIERSSTSDIFDSCFLVTGKSEIDGSMGEPDKESMRVVSDTVMSLVKKSKVSEDEFLVKSFMDNNPGEIKSTVDIHKEIPKDAGFVFNSIGYGTISLPLEQMFTFAANQMYQDFKDVWSVKASQQDIENELTKFRLLPQELYDDIFRKSAKNMLGTGDVELPLKDEITNGIYYSGIKATWRKFNGSFIDAIEASANIVTAGLTESIERELQSVLLDKGVSYVSELLQGKIYEESTVNGIITRLKTEYINSVHDYKITIDTEREEYKRKREYLERNKPVFKLAWIKDYRDVCVNEMNCDTRYIVFDMAETALEQIIAHLDVKLEEIVRYNEILVYLGEIMEENFKLARKKPIGESYAVQLFDMSRKDEQTLLFLNWLKEQVAAPNDAVKKARAGKLVQTMLNTKKFWMKSDNAENFRPVNVIMEFMEDEYKFLREMTLEKFSVVFFGADNIAEGIENIFHILMAKGALMAKPHTTFSHWKTWVRHSYITIPGGMGSIPNAIRKQASINGISQATGMDLNNISYINMICGMPLYALDDISTYERIYEESVRNTNGVHIIENEKEDLINLPPLVSKDGRGFLKVPNQREIQYLKEYETMIKDYLSIGIIWKTDFSYYSYFIPEDSSLDMEEVKTWCHEVYLKDNPKPDMEGFKNGFDKEFLDENRNLRSVMVDIDRLYLQNIEPEQGLQRFMRYYITLKANLDGLYHCFTECMQVIGSANKNEENRRKLVKAAERYYNYVYMGILKHADHSSYGGIIVLTDEKGEEFILCYEDDFKDKEKQMSIYNGCMELWKCDYNETMHEAGINAEFLERLDEFAEEKKKDRSKMAERRADKEQFVKKLEAESKLILSLDMKNYLGDRLEEVRYIYETLDSLI